MIFSLAMKTICRFCSCHITKTATSTIDSTLQIRLRQGRKMILVPDVVQKRIGYLHFLIRHRAINIIIFLANWTPLHVEYPLKSSSISQPVSKAFIKKEALQPTHTCTRSHENRTFLDFLITLRPRALISFYRRQGAKGPGCPSCYDAGLTNQYSRRFDSRHHWSFLNFMWF